MGMDQEQTPWMGRGLGGEWMDTSWLEGSSGLLEAEMGVFPQVRGYGWRHRKERGTGQGLGRAPFRAPLLPAFPPHSLLPGSHSHVDLVPTLVRKGAHFSLCSPPLSSPCYWRQIPTSVMKTPEGTAGSRWEQEDGGG